MHRNRCRLVEVHRNCWRATVCVSLRGGQRASTTRSEGCRFGSVVVGQLARYEAGEEPGLLGEKPGDWWWGSGFANGYGSALGPLVWELDVASGPVDRRGRLQDVA